MGKSTAFREYEDEKGQNNVLFNRGREDGDTHGHVITSDNGETTNYARDEDGNVYVDDSE